MNHRTALIGLILSATLSVSSVSVCHGRFASLPWAWAFYANNPQPDAVKPQDASPTDSPQHAFKPGAQLNTSPIVSQRAVPLDGGGPDRQVLPGTLAVSPDSANVAYRLRYGNDLGFDGFVYNGYKPIGGKRFNNPAYAPDSQSVAVVFFDHGWKLRHGRTFLDAYEPVTPVRFSPDGQRLIYLARLEDQRFVVEGDQPQPLAQSIAWDQLVFTADSAILAYPAFDGQHWRMVVNADPGPTWDRLVTAPVTAEQGQRVLFVAVRNGRYFVVDRHTPGNAAYIGNTGGNTGGNSGGNTGGGDIFGGASGDGDGFRLIDASPVISADGKTFAYWALSDDLVWRVYQNHQPVRGYEADRPGEIVLSRDGQTLAAILKRNGQWFVVQNTPPPAADPGTHAQTLSPGYPAVGKDSLTLSPDGQHLAYAVKTPHGWAVVVDEVQQPSYVQLAAQSLRFSPDSQLFAYAALHQGRWSVILNDTTTSPVMRQSGLAGGVLTHPTQPPTFNQINAASLTFSPDSQHLAYLAYNAGQANVVLDNQPLGEYDRAQQLTFSPDSRHLVYLAQQAGQSFLAVDGTPSTELFDEPVLGANIHFTNATHCQTVAIRRPGPTFARIELNLTPLPEDDPAPGTDGPYKPDATPVPPAEPLSPFVDVPTP